MQLTAKGDVWNKQIGELDPQRYRGKIKIRAFVRPVSDVEGRKFDSGDPRFDRFYSPTALSGELVDYQTEYYRGDYGTYGEDFVLIRFSDGREYWYEWSEMHFTKLK